MLFSLWRATWDGIWLLAVELDMDSELIFDSNVVFGLDLELALDFYYDLHNRFKTTCTRARLYIAKENGTYITKGLNHATAKIRALPSAN